MASLVVAMAITASADVLLWQVPGTEITGATDPKTGGTTTISQSSGDYQWTYAMLRYTTETSLDPDSAGNAGSAISVFTTSGTSLGTEVDQYYSGKKMLTDSIDDKVGDNVKWYIALYNDDGALMGYSSLMSNDYINDFRAVSRNIADWSAANTMSGSGWTAAPEPTSGVLLLLGAAVLGLRRRKVA